MAFQVFFYVFASVSDTCFKFSVFTRMLQMFHLNVSKNKSGVASERAVSVWGLQVQATFEQRGRLDARIYPDVWALALSYSYRQGCLLVCTHSGKPQAITMSRYLNV
jgi:hypothetical protein